MPDPQLLAQADAAVRAGDLAPGARLLQQALAEARHATSAQWLQLAGLHRALRQPRRALDAVHRALTLAPMDFMALVMRASLLERLGSGDAGQAWDEALAQRPPGDLPGPLAEAVAAGERSLAAWKADRERRLAEATAAHEQQAREQDADEDEAWRIARFRSNALRQTKVYHAEPTHYHYPGLAEREFHPRHRFLWLAELEAATDVIRAELRIVMASERAELVPYLDYNEHEALAQFRPLNRNKDWTAIHLIRRGEVVEANAALCPQTMALLRKFPQPEVPGASANAMFSLLAPQNTIPPHVGVTNTRLLCHLPLIVPPGCWFRVGAETRLWREGEAFVFDDSVEHEATNPSNQLRVVLIFDVWHPDLSPVEQQAIAALVAAEGGFDGAS